MAGGVDEVEGIGLAVIGSIIEPDGTRLDGDAALALKIHIVEDLLLHIALRDRAGLFQDAVGKGGLAVVNMGNNTEVSDQFSVQGNSSVFGFWLLSYTVIIAYFAADVKRFRQISLDSLPPDVLYW